MTRGPNQRKELRRALFLADLGLLLALFIVLFALYRNWVKPVEPPPSPTPQDAAETVPNRAFGNLLYEEGVCRL